MDIKSSRSIRNWLIYKYQLDRGFPFDTQLPLLPINQSKLQSSVYSAGKNEMLIKASDVQAEKKIRFHT